MRYSPNIVVVLLVFVILLVFFVILQVFLVVLQAKQKIKSQIRLQMQLFFYVN